MNTTPTVAIDYGLWQQQLACLEALAPHTPIRRARTLRGNPLVAEAHGSHAE